MNCHIKFIFLSIHLLIVQISFSQKTDITKINFLSQERTPEIIIDYFDKVADGNFDIKVFKDHPQIYSDGASDVLMIYKESGTGYLYINQTVETTMDSTDTRKVEYFLNKEVVDNFKTVKKLIKLKKKDVLLIDIDDSQEFSFVKVYISVK
ncbi:hypothetical protein [Aquiflexum gelatinilyticum]|uniref:Uncharacterized protein n=1 Tax=Aquiflexum gelatinilyticum TaxID=2961943 RepID=A0A9X2PAS4_9BACT|nr:hypothetical protein [Aquiflexum gelatinilyticum]MCR9016602.1 hypothetical protein [Aquiflexum gelatinilyticum]MCS4436495.1 hypothetical protein [Aquiflexum gelatinilyticum]